MAVFFSCSDVVKLTFDTPIELNAYQIYVRFIALSVQFDYF